MRNILRTVQQLLRSVLKAFRWRGRAGTLPTDPIRLPGPKPAVRPRIPDRRKPPRGGRWSPHNPLPPRPRSSRRRSCPRTDAPPAGVRRREAVRRRALSVPTRSASARSAEPASQSSGRKAYRLLPVVLGVALLGIGGVVGPSVVGGGWNPGGAGPDRERITYASLPDGRPGAGPDLRGAGAGRSGLAVRGLLRAGRARPARTARTPHRPGSRVTPRRRPGHRRRRRSRSQPRREAGTVPPDAEIVRDEGGSALTAGRARRWCRTPRPARPTSSWARTTWPARATGAAASGCRCSTCTSSARRAGTPTSSARSAPGRPGSTQIFDASAAETGGSRHVRFVTTPAVPGRRGRGAAAGAARCSPSRQHRRAADARLQPHRPQVPDLRGHQRLLRHRHLRRRQPSRSGQPQQRRAVVRPGRLGLLELGGGRARADPHAGRAAAGLAQLHRRGRLHRRLRPALRPGPVGNVAVRTVCPKKHENRLDCGHDDYFSTDPKPGSYLAKNWNVAQSEFLLRSDGGDDVPDAPGGGAPEAPDVPDAAPTTEAPAAPATATPAPEAAGGDASDGGGDAVPPPGVPDPGASAEHRRPGRRCRAAAGRGAGADLGPGERRGPATAGGRAGAGGPRGARRDQHLGPADLERRGAERDRTRCRSTACRSRPRWPPGPG